MDDETVISKLEYISFVKKVTVISIISGTVLFLLFRLTGTDFFMFLGLFLFSWSILYGLSTIISLLILAKNSKMLLWQIITTFSIIVLSFVLATIYLYYGFMYFIQISD
ncbi:hypothetical protein [Flavobacterium sp.]|jgi:hypothetical protein|uniref:hypothetical protein n=1 Tax=Flavobacterium sp. TaxID=239 RepID=UPI0037C1B1A1